MAEDGSTTNLQQVYNKLKVVQQVGNIPQNRPTTACCTWNKSTTKRSNGVWALSRATVHVTAATNRTNRHVLCNIPPLYDFRPST